MNFPASFQTQSLGPLQKDGHSYRPTNHNAHRFRFEPSAGTGADHWPSLIDRRVPFLNGQWPSLLAENARLLKDALSGLGKIALGKDATLQHLTLQGDGSAILLIACSPSEEGLALEVVIDAQDRITAITPTR